MAGVETSFYATQPTNKPQSPMEAMKDVMPIALGQQALSHDQFRQAQEQINASNQLFGTIAANPSLDTVASVAAQLHLMNVPAPMIQQGLQEFIAADAKGATPEEKAANIRALAFSHIQRHGTALENMQAGGLAPATLTNTGSELIPTRVQSGPNAGIYRAGGSAIPVEASPEAMMGRVPGVDPQTGVPYTAPQSTLSDRRGNPLTGAPAVPRAPVMQPAVRGATVVPPAAPVSPSNLPPGAVPTGLAPGVGEGMKNVGAGGGALLDRHLGEATNYQARIYPLETAVESLTALGKTGTGPGKEELNKIKSFFQSAGVPGIDADKITNFDEAKKSLTQYARMNGDTATNDQLSAAFAGSPSVNISQAAALQMSKVALSLARMKQVMTLDYANSGKPESGYSKYAATFQNNNDPRAFGFDKMTPEKQAELIKSLGPRDSPAFQKFQKSFNLAHEYGVLGGKSLNQ